MPLYSPPADIVRDLKEFDPALRLRWSDAQGQWRLERKVSRGQTWPGSSTPDSPAGYESWIAARDGYILVDLIPANALNKRLVPVLRQNDIWAHGGAEAVADAMDQLDLEQKWMMKRAIDDEFEAAARERFRYMNRPRVVPESMSHTAPPGGMSIND